MPQKRNPENRGFPTGWRVLHGAIYYKVPKSVRHLWDNKQLFRLGNTPSEAYRTWAERVNKPSEIETIGEIVSRYLIEVTPTKAPKSQRVEQSHARKLIAVFGDVLPVDLEPHHIYRFYDLCPSKVSAKRQVALLSHALTKAVEWGVIKAHPFKGQIRLKGEKPRSRLLEDWEFVEMMKLVPFRKEGSVKLCQTYALFKRIAGQRRNDILSIRIADLKEEGIHITPNKTKHTTGVKLILKWTPALRAATDLLLSLRPVDISPWLICNKYGESYYNPATGESYGFDSMWSRFIDRLIEETAIEERFTDSDIRAKAATDSKSLELAQMLLGHSNPALTKRVYRRLPQMVEPAQ